MRLGLPQPNYKARIIFTVREGGLIYCVQSPTGIVVVRLTALVLNDVLGLYLRIFWVPVVVRAGAGVKLIAHRCSPLVCSGEFHTMSITECFQCMVSDFG